MNITEKVTTYESACEIEGVNPQTSLPFPDAQNADEKAINAVAKLFRIARVLNEGWQPDWNDYDQYKYYPWFDMETYRDKAAAGSGFSFHDFVYDRSSSLVGSRLVFKSRDLARYAGKQFESIYREFMVIEK